MLYSRSLPLPGSSHNRGTTVFTQQLFCPQGDIYRCLETFLVVTAGGEVYWHLVGGTQGHCSTSHSAQDSPHQRILRPKCQRGQAGSPSYRKFCSPEIRAKKPVSETLAFFQVNLSCKVLARAPNGQEWWFPPVHTTGYMSGFCVFS